MFYSRKSLVKHIYFFCRKNVAKICLFEYNCYICPGTYLSTLKLRTNMKKMKFFAMAFAAIVAVAFNACKPQNEPNPDDGGDVDKTPTQVEAKLEGMSVLTYRGQSMYKDIEQYSAVFTNEANNEQYSVTLISYNTNNLKAPAEGTYTIVNELTAADQAAATKLIGETKVQVDSGNVVVKGNNTEMEITMNITLSDGEKEIVHYKGAVTVEKFDYAGASEPKNPVNVTLKADTAYYEFYAADDKYLAQSRIQMFDFSQRYHIEFFMFFQSEANKTAQTQPTGTFTLNMKPSETEDFVQIGDYAIYEDYYSQGYYPPFTTIKPFDTEGYYTGNILFPQTGTVEITQGEGDAYNIKLTDWVTYNGSKFSGEFVAQKYIEKEESNSAPLKIAAKPAKTINISLINNIEFPVVKLARK